MYNYRVRSLINQLFDITRLGAAGIYSNVTPCAEKIRYNVSGMLCQNVPDKWTETLMLLLENPDLRKAIYLRLKSGAKTVAQSCPYSLSSIEDRRFNQQWCCHCRAQCVGPIRDASLPRQGDRTGLSTYRALAAADSSDPQPGTARSIASRRRGRSRLACLPRRCAKVSRAVCSCSVRCNPAMAIVYIVLNRICSTVTPGEATIKHVRKD
jgi:hypothetical protein